MRPYIFIFLFASFSFSLSAQNTHAIDSLMVEYELAKDAELKVDILNHLAKLVYKYDQQRALGFSNEALELAQNAGYEMGLARVYLRLGSIYKVQSNFPKAMVYYQQSLEIFQHLDYQRGIASLNNNIGLIYSGQRMYSNAMEHYLVSLNINEKIGNKTGIANTYNNIGNLFQNNLDYDKATKYFYESLKIKLEINDDAGVASNYNNLGNIAKVRGEMDKAMAYYVKALKINQKMGNKEWLGVNYMNLGLMHLFKSNADSALVCFKKSIHLFSEIKDELEICNANIYMSDAHLILKQKDSAKMYLSKAYSLGMEHAYHNSISSSAQKMSELYAEEDDFQNAYTYFVNSRNSRDTITKNENLSKFYQLEFQYQLAKETELHKSEQRQKELKYQNSKLILLGSLLITFIVLIMIIVILKNRIKRSKLANDIFEIEKIRLNEKIDYNNKELINFALHTIQKNELMDSIKVGMKEVINSDETERLAKARSLYLRIFQSTKVNEEMNSFQKRTEEVNAVFIAKLDELFPGLTKKEKRLSILLRLNFITKEIAALTKISPRSVEMNRSRLRKKLNVPSDINLSDYFQSL